MTGLGLAIITQNEELHIPATIAQFYHVIQDVVVVDGGSSDGTVMWAERMGARVIKRPFRRDFSDQKNFAIRQLSTPWVYLHDPDERLEPTTIDILPLLITEEGQDFLKQTEVLPNNSEAPFDCFGFARKNFIDGVQTQIYPDYQYRLFRNYCYFEGKVHEQIRGFNNRTEVDYTRPDAARPASRELEKRVPVDTERGQVETGVDIWDTAQISRFNILHYKSSSKQAEQDRLYRVIRGKV